MSSCEKRPPHRRHSKIGWPLWEGLRTVYCGRSNGFNADRACVALITTMEVVYLAVCSRGIFVILQTVLACAFASQLVNELYTVYW